MDLDYGSLAELVALAEARGGTVSELVLEQQAEQLEESQEQLYERMREQYKVMEASAAQGLKEGVRSASGLTGGDAHRVRQRLEEGRSLCGPVFAGALARAMAVAEWNAAMGRIVAAPTAGACGILPGTLLSLRQALGLGEREVVMALFTAGAVGLVLSGHFQLAGAKGGCQAECGAASAMAAAAAVELAGGAPFMVGNAVAIALKSSLGLVCDPVAGLVEAPCIKRNAAGTATALMAAELALAGVASLIPADEVMQAMKRVGDAMPPALRETAEGGLAATPTAKRLYERVFGKGCEACGACAGE